MIKIIFTAFCLVCYSNVKKIKITTIFILNEKN